MCLFYIYAHNLCMWNTKLHHTLYLDKDLTVIMRGTKEFTNPLHLACD